MAPVADSYVAHLGKLILIERLSSKQKGAATARFPRAVPCAHDKPKGSLG